MTVMRSDTEVAVDEVAIACKRARARLDDAADLADRDAPDMAAPLRALAGDAGALAAALEAVVEDLGGLPGAPDDDYEFLSDAFRHLREGLSADHRGVLIDEALTAEDAVAEALGAALDLGEDLPPAARTTLERVRAHVARARETLDGLRALRPD